MATRWSGKNIYSIGSFLAKLPQPGCGPQSKVTASLNLASSTYLSLAGVPMAISVIVPLGLRGSVVIVPC